MLNILNKLLLVMLIAGFISCGGSSGSSSSSSGSNGDGGGTLDSTLRVLASNVIMGSDVNASTNNAVKHSDVDTTTQVLAENVVLDTTALGIESENVQTAFEETRPVLSTLLLDGPWAITEVIDCGGVDAYTKSNGTITFNADGTFTLSGVSKDLDGTSGDPECASSFYHPVQLIDSNPTATLAFSTINDFLFSLKFNKTDGLLNEGYDATVHVEAYRVIAFATGEITAVGGSYGTSYSKRPNVFFLRNSDYPTD